MLSERCEMFKDKNGCKTYFCLPTGCVKTKCSHVSKKKAVVKKQIGWNTACKIPTRWAVCHVKVCFLSTRPPFLDSRVYVRYKFTIFFISLLAAGYGAGLGGCVGGWTGGNYVYGGDLGVVVGRRRCREKGGERWKEGARVTYMGLLALVSSLSALLLFTFGTVPC